MYQPQVNLSDHLQQDEAVLRALLCLREAYHINVQGVIECHDVFGLPAYAVNDTSGDSNYE